MPFLAGPPTGGEIAALQRIRHTQEEDRPITPPEAPTRPAAPTTARGFRRQVRAARLRQSLLRRNVESFIRAGEQLLDENNLLKHENAFLKETVKTEQRRRKHGKPLGLLNKEHAGQAQFFSPARIQAARERADELDAQKQQKAAQVEGFELRRAVQKDQKAVTLAERKAARAEGRCGTIPPPPEATAEARS
ncbi:hypothetical protein CIHG_09949 [Coccidioides immitis H538.4]|uniref:Uncharacterized protein n=1 Tax=Coccidioides immitis H538.4 TaxID=396776 RepID=A0A0J8S718_COCIT|nr:hypothetical protein CIHG_09949 [Coccidioides immitis H538.4]